MNERLVVVFIVSFVLAFWLYSYIYPERIEAARELRNNDNYRYDCDDGDTEDESPWDDLWI